MGQDMLKSSAVYQVGLRDVLAVRGDINNCHHDKFFSIKVLLSSDLRSLNDSKSDKESRDEITTLTLPLTILRARFRFRFRFRFIDV